MIAKSVNYRTSHNVYYAIFVDWFRIEYFPNCEFPILFETFQFYLKRECENVKCTFQFYLKRAYRIMRAQEKTAR